MQTSIQRRPSAFTLVEMVVVVSIILVIVVLIVPAASTLWEERKKADAFNTIQGMIKTSRALALRADGKERGFLAYVGEDGVQRLVSIEQAQPPFDPNPLAQADLRTAYENIFDVTPDRVVTMPAPLRAVPRYVVDLPTGGSDTYSHFSEDELQNNSFQNPVLASNHKAQRHRNFFTMVFSSSGEVLVGREVLIRDLSEDLEAPGDMHGDLTDMLVGDGDPADLSDDGAASVSQFWFRNAGTESQQAIHPAGLGIPFLVVDPEDPTTAFSFYSVDSPLLYDDEVFNQITDKVEKREWLLTNAQPMYLNRWTGSVIRGPIGEVQTQ